MNLLFVADSLKFGGAERHTAVLAGALARRGHDVTVAALKDQDELGEQLRAAGVERQLCFHSRGQIDLAALRRMAAHIDAAAPQVLVATSQYSLMYCVLARRLARRRPGLAFISHSMDVVRHNRKERLRFMVYSRLYRMADCVVFVTGAQRRFFTDLGVRLPRTELIHTGLDLQRFAPGAIDGGALRRQLGLGDGDLVIGLCAVFREEKRHIDLLHAVAQLRRQGVPARAVLVGDGPLRAEIEQCRAALGLQDAVVLAGFQADVRPYIAACDVMTLTSRAEAFPLATLEYMAMGKPVVASDVGGLREQVEDGVNGLLYPAADVAALAAALGRVAQPGLRDGLGQGALATVRERFDIGLMTTRYEQVFASLAPAAGPAVSHSVRGQHAD